MKGACDWGGGCEGLDGWGEEEGGLGLGGEGEGKEMGVVRCIVYTY